MAEGTLKIHTENILPIIKKWLYSSKDIFLRELVSNAQDAIQKLMLLEEGDASFRIDITLDTEKKTIQISDNGIGMTADEVEKYIAQLAFSGAEEFLAAYKKNEEENPFIGHFGLGFYSAFMVSHSVEIQTLSYQENAKAVHWTSDGSSTYQIEEGTRTTRGTDILLHIQEEEFLEAEKIRELLTTYCRFLPVPIFFGTERINKEDPLWIKPAKDCTESDYINFYHSLYPLEPNPIFWIHINVEHPFHVKGILYFPKMSSEMRLQDAHIKLFSNRVYVTDECKDLFPHFLNVLRGAVDSFDLPLNVSRSTLQMDSTVKKLASHISKKIADRLTALYEEDREKYTAIWPEIQTIIKLGLLNDEKFYDRIQGSLLWKTTNNNWTTLASYQERNPSQKKVFYTMYETKESPFLSLYKEKGIEVLIAGGPLDSVLFNNIEAKTELEFQRIDGGIDDLILDSEKQESELLDADGRTDSSKLASFVKENLSKSEVTVEAKALTSSNLPAFLMIDEKTRRLSEYFALTQKDLPKELLKKHTFVINTNNKLIATINQLKEKEPTLAKKLIEHIYDLSLLSQKEFQADNLSSFVERSNALVEELVSRSNA